MSLDNRLFVVRPSLPPLSELLPLLEEIWASRMLTNGGPIHERFEAALAQHLGLQHLTLVTNATLGLMLACRQLQLTGEVITSPFSFVATAHAMKWAGLEPVFADISAESLNLDPAGIEAAITGYTSAILPVHCFGRSCDTAGISAVAERHGLKVIYDGAHAFGVTDQGGSILRHGDLSVMSFHATKVFNTFEGGAIVSPDAQTRASLERLKNFGIVDETHVDAIGLNAKMTEFSAAVGLMQLGHVDELLAQRQTVDSIYRELLAGVAGVQCLQCPPPCQESGCWNHYCFPVLIGPEYPLTRDQLYMRLCERGVHARRYFSPLISNLPMYRHLPSAAPENLPVANDVSSRILALPMYPDLSREDQERVVDLLRKPLA